MAQKGYKLDFDLPKITKELDKGFEKAVKKAVFTVHRHLIKKLRGSRSGRRYMVPATSTADTQGTSAGEGKKPKKPKFYTASAPNEPPAVRLGDLRTSYRPVVEGKGMLSVGKVGTPLPYSIWLEKGTSRMAPRPHVKPAFLESKDEWIKHFEDLL